MKNKEIITHQVSLVYADTLLQDLPEDILDELWDNCPFSFGDTNYSLIRADYFKDWLLDIVDNDDHEDVLATVKEIADTLDNLTRANVFVDIEH